MNAPGRWEATADLVRLLVAEAHPDLAVRLPVLNDESAVLPAIAHLSRAADEVDSVALQDIWSDAVNAPEWEAPPVRLDGDLPPANVITNNGALTGVVDFGEMRAGDPAVDLSAAWKPLAANPPGAPQATEPCAAREGCRTADSAPPTALPGYRGPPPTPRCPDARAHPPARVTRQAPPPPSRTHQVRRA
ncbi:phosphotransferase [Actinosynnema pretiosum subsp. pretiosum]|uniref:Phosphotransferase n=1 Tax=Actinosynnema pretiosum subsp. pretiosum TaxID=103721 RepID=A0AA45LAF4_9PSEU|nr:phosphotransferase [Actinosynnema pretiosum subsp. pretiosum]